MRYATPWRWPTILKKEMSLQNNPLFEVVFCAWKKPSSKQPEENKKQSKPIESFRA
jgi:hypothetical protein